MGPERMTTRSGEREVTNLLADSATVWNEL
jgi:hypothetical protein